MAKDRFWASDEWLKRTVSIGGSAVAMVDEDYPGEYWVSRGRGSVERVPPCEREVK